MAVLEAEQEVTSSVEKQGVNLLRYIYSIKQVPEALMVVMEGDLSIKRTFT